MHLWIDELQLANAAQTGEHGKFQPLIGVLTVDLEQTQHGHTLGRRSDLLANIHHHPLSALACSQAEKMLQVWTRGKGDAVQTRRGRPNVEALDNFWS